jgi:hypothetical protein
VGAVLVAWALAEGLFLLWLRQPALLAYLPANLGRHVRGYYLQHDRSLLQADARFARYDPELLYTLAPGHFRFRNREFDVAFEVNSLGVRDSEAALREPALVVLGDSFAMGWGVEAGETFAAQLRGSTGLAVLNAGVSSYGTVRELLLLRRIDTRATRCLVLQHDDNDAWENRHFASADGVLEPRPRERFEHTLLKSAAQRRYWPGKVVFEIVRAALTPRSESLDEPIPGVEEQVRLFLDVLQRLAPTRHAAHAGERPGHASVGLDGPDPQPDLPVLVLSLNPDGRGAGAFERQLAQRLGEPGSPAVARRVHVVPLAGVLTSADFFRLDDHLRPSGHARVAQALLPELARQGCVVR